jgi:ABC-type transporter MlaC component
MQRETGMMATRRRPAVPLALAFSALMLTGGLSAHADTSALETTQQFVNQALQIMADKQLPVANRSSQLRAVLEPHFDFREMARQSLGPHWRELTQAQRQDFSNVFKDFI